MQVQRESEYTGKACEEYVLFHWMDRYGGGKFKL